MFDIPVHDSERAGLGERAPRRRSQNSADDLSSPGAQKPPVSEQNGGWRGRGGIATRGKQRWVEGGGRNFRDGMYRRGSGGV